MMQLIGRDADIAIDVITTEHFHTTLMRPRWRCKILARRELLAILPADTRLIDQARLYSKTTEIHSAEPR